jgi:hypothetical protein
LGNRRYILDGVVGDLAAFYNRRIIG